VGYVLSDDDLGDSYTVDILNDKVYGVPAFKLVAGRSSCPWEPGTLPREGVQLISNTYSQSVPENQAAVFVLQLGNTSQSNETMTYDLVFDHTTNPDGAALTIGGSPIVGNIPYPYTIAAGQGTNATITVSKGPTAYDYNGLKFTLKSSCDDNISQDVFLNVHFYKEYNLTVAVNGSGTTNISTGVHPYQEGSNVVLYASPLQGYVFQYWVVGSNVYTSQAIQVTMDADKTATAIFAASTLPQHSLQVSSVGNGTTIPPAGTHYFTEDSIATILAIPDMYNAFEKWVINGVDIFDPDTAVTMSANTVAVAHFIETHSVTVAISQGHGTTTPPEGVNTFADGTLLHMFASPALGYVFEKWVIDSVEYTTQNVDVTVTGNISAQAYFVATTDVQFVLTMSVNGVGGTTSPPVGQHYFTQGSLVTITAFPDTGKIFQQWSVNSIVSTINPESITVTGPVDVEAFFINDDVSIGNIESNNVSSLFPNPSNGIVNIRSSSAIHKVVVSDIIGNIVYENYNINDSNFSLNLAYLNSGVYFVKLYNETASSVFKIQIVK
jgi:hypothetical protein